MAAPAIIIYRNYDSSDTTRNTSYRVGDILPSIDDLGWSAPTNKIFKEWNTARDGTGTSYDAGDFAEGGVYAIWEEEPVPIDYLTNDQELTSIANAIRIKGGTSASLTYPSGFVSAIQAISTGTDVSDTTAAAGDVLSGKYFYTANGTKTQGTIATKTASNLSASGKTVTVPAGYYASQYTKDVATGSATTPATTITANPSISVNNSTGVITATASTTQSVTPTVSSGYVASGTAGTITVSGSNTSSLTTQAAQTITPTTTDQTIASGKYLTGTQTIKGDTNLLAGNIKKNIQIFGITGTYEGNILPSATGVSFGNYLITFYFMGNEFTALNDMTWDEFLDSTYNTGVFGYYGNNGVNGWGVELFYNSNAVQRTDTIIENGQYDSGG